MTIGENIKRIRKEKKLTQKKLGDLCGIDEANIRKYESGRQIPKLSTLGKIATALGVREKELMSGKEADANPIISEFTLLVIKEKLKRQLYGYTADEKRQIAERIDNDIEKIYDIEDENERTVYANRAVSDLFQEISDHILSKRNAHEVLDCLDLMGYYFSFKYDIREYVMKFMDYLYGNQKLHMGYMSTPPTPEDLPQD